MLKHFAPILALLAVLAGSHWRSATAAEPIKVLEFPREISIGRLYEVNPNVDWVLQQDILGRFLGPARGTVRVPERVKVLLDLDVLIMQHPDILKSFKVKNVFALRVRSFEEAHGLLPFIVDMDDLRRVDLMDSELTDAEAALLAKLPLLQRICLRSCELNGSCLAALKNISQLKHLDMSNNTCGTGNMANVAMMKNLISLDLARSGQTDAGIVKLAALKNLERLDLKSNIGVGMPSLKALAQCRNLKSLNVSNTSVKAMDVLVLKGLPLGLLRLGKDANPVNIASLRRVFPGCVIEGELRSVTTDNQTLYAPLHY